jgi:hypothetical protein
MRGKQEASNLSLPDSSEYYMAKGIEEIHIEILFEILSNKKKESSSLQYHTEMKRI